MSIKIRDSIDATPREKLFDPTEIIIAFCPKYAYKATIINITVELNKKKKKRFPWI